MIALEIALIFLSFVFGYNLGFSNASGRLLKVIDTYKEVIEKYRKSLGLPGRIVDDD
jgi:hypothetical protein